MHKIAKLAGSAVVASVSVAAAAEPPISRIPDVGELDCSKCMPHTSERGTIRQNICWDLKNRPGPFSVAVVRNIRLLRTENFGCALPHALDEGCYFYGSTLVYSFDTITFGRNDFGLGKPTHLETDYEYGVGEPPKEWAGIYLDQGRSYTVVFNTYSARIEAKHGYLPVLVACPAD